MSVWNEKVFTLKQIFVLVVIMLFLHGLTVVAAIGATTRYYEDVQECRQLLWKAMGYQ